MGQGTIWAFEINYLWGVNWPQMVHMFRKKLWLIANFSQAANTSKTIARSKATVL